MQAMANASASTSMISIGLTMYHLVCFVALPQRSSHQDFQTAGITAEAVSGSPLESVVCEILSKNRAIQHDPGAGRP